PGRPRTRRPVAHRPGAGDRSRGRPLVFRPPPPLPDPALGLDRRAAPRRRGLPREVPPARRTAPACADQDEVIASPARDRPGRDPQRIPRPEEVETMKYTTIFAHLEPQDRIRCQTQETRSQPEGYPVLSLGAIDVFPSVEQLRHLRDEIDAWLGAEAAREQAAHAGLGAGI